MTCLIGKEQNIFNSAACEKPFQVYGRMRISSRWTGSSRLKTLPAHHCILWNSAAFQATLSLTVPLQRDISQAEGAGELYQWQPKSFLYSQTTEAHSQACQRTVRSRMGTETGTCGSTRVFEQWAEDAGQNTTRSLRCLCSPRQATCLQHGWGWEGAKEVTHSPKPHSHLMFPKEGDPREQPAEALTPPHSKAASHNTPKFGKSPN